MTIPNRKRDFEILLSPQEVASFLQSLPALPNDRICDELHGVQIQRVLLPTSEWISKIPEIAPKGRFLIVDCPLRGLPLLAYESGPPPAS